MESLILERKRIHIRGIVQGVGFRPFVHRCASELGLRGWVLNTASGVSIEAEGQAAQLRRLLRRLRTGAPPLARIEEIVVEDIAGGGPFPDDGFVIRDSVDETSAFSLVSPDVATCEACLAEVLDPANRRAGYPFTNCTNCGPRYSITIDVPYDRASTTMAVFAMCPACQAEYDDPANRRFHAQPNACPSCGPALSSPIAEVRRLLRDGVIVGVKGLGGFHLACNAFHEAAVNRLRSRKRRGGKPFALMAASLDAAHRICHVSSAEAAALLDWRRPIVILRRKCDAGIPEAVAPGNQTLGVMLPYTPLHHLLFRDRPGEPPCFDALVMTSGNLAEEPIVVSNDDAVRRLGSIAGAFLLHNRDIHTRVDDSIVRVFDGAPRVLRRSRGYAPEPIDLGEEVCEVFAAGAELKNTFCFTKGRYAIPSQHIGDLENYETLEFYEETFERMQRLFRVSPRAAAFDLHPLYLSTRFVGGMTNIARIGVQHHHAHIASCAAENHLRGPVIGVAFDGTGYGDDGRIWGGEFLVADYEHYERRAHIRYVPLPGGDTAIRQPWRFAASCLWDALGSEAANVDLPLWRDIPETQLQFVKRMIERRVNSIDTSSCGRWFDAIASIIGLRHETTFEAQAAIDLEMAVPPGVEDAYPFEFEDGQIDLRPTVAAIVRDAGSPPLAAARFHNTMAAIVAEGCRRIRRSDGLGRVCLSGGAFQNLYLLERTAASLCRLGFKVFLHAKVPCNDGGVALGQAVIANARIAKGG